MTDIRNMSQEVQAEILKTVRKGQETIVDAIHTVRAMTPELPDLNLSLWSRNLPLASKLPKPEELAGSAYSFAMRVLADQRKFAEDVLHSTGQLLPGYGGTGARKTPAAAEHNTGTAKTTGNSGAHGTGSTKTSGTHAASKTTGASGAKKSGPGVSSK